MALEQTKFSKAMAREGARILIAAILSGEGPESDHGSVEDHVTLALQALHTLGKCEAYAEMGRPFKGDGDGNR